MKKSLPPLLAANCAAINNSPRSGIRFRPSSESSPQPFHTPGRKTIADVAEFTALPETSQMKSLVLVAHGKPILVMLRGDHQLNEAKFGAISGDPEFRPAHPDEIRDWFGADAG